MSFAERIIDIRKKLPHQLSSHVTRKPTEIKIGDTYEKRHNPKTIPVKDKNGKREIEQIYYPTDSSLAEEYIWDIMTGLSGKTSFGPYGLRQLFESGYNPAFFEGQENPDVNLLAKKSTYVFQRLVAKEHIPLLADADIHFTDNARDFYKGIDNKISLAYIPNKRARVYRVDTDNDGRTHLTYLLRHSDSSNYIDAFEMVSFLSFIEFFKEKIRNNQFDTNGKAGDELRKDFKTLGFTDVESIKKWADNKGQRLALRPSEHFSLLAPWETYQNQDVYAQGKIWEHGADVISDAVWMIKKKIEKMKITVPDHVLLGNDFSVPLMATLGLFDNNDIDKVFELASPNNTKPGEPTLDREEIEKEIKNIQDPIDKNTLRKFRVYQYLNIYNGHNPDLIGMRRSLDSIVNKMRIRVVSAGETGLGSPVDMIDFGKVDAELIKQIEHPKIRELMLNLNQQNARVLSLSYPLGENIGPLVRLLHDKLRIEKIGFFGKVGSVVDANGEGGVKRGRVIIPEFFTRVGESGEQVFNKIRNLLHHEDAILIPEPDNIEAIIATNSILLQSANDIATYKSIAEKLKEKPRILLDSESFYLQKVCNELNIDPAIIYYVSDNTTLDGRPYKDMTHALGAEGTLAALESPLSILNKWFTDLPLKPKIYFPE